MIPTILRRLLSTSSEQHPLANAAAVKAATRLIQSRSSTTPGFLAPWQITSFTNTGFILSSSIKSKSADSETYKENTQQNERLQVSGGLVQMPYGTMQWLPISNIEDLKLNVEQNNGDAITTWLDHVHPQPSLIVLGLGAQVLAAQTTFIQKLQDKLTLEYGIQVLVADTKRAVDTYALMTEEGRSVMAFLLPHS